MRACAILMLAGAWEAAALGAATSRPAVPIELAPVVQAHQRMLQQRPMGGRFKLSDLVTLTIENGKLKAPIGQAARVPGGERRIEMEDMGGQWKMNYMLVQGAQQSEYLMLTRYDFDSFADFGIWCINFYSHSLGTVSISALAGNNEKTISLYSGPTGVRLTITDLPQRGVPVVNAMAASMEELRSKYPKEVRQYVRPILQRLGGHDVLGVKAADVYRAFPQIHPDENTRKRVDELVAALDAAGAEQREKASAALAAMGAPAVLAALRLDGSLLAPEQQARLSAFIKQHDEQRAMDPEKARRDPVFLISCLEFEDPKARAAAKDALVELLGKPVSFDVNAPPAARAAAADAIWQTVFSEPIQPAVGPQTRPSQGIGPVN